MAVKIKTLLSLDDYVMYLRSLTTADLLNLYPRRFHDPGKLHDFDAWIANNAILYNFIGNYSQFLKLELQSHNVAPLDGSQVLSEPDHYFTDAGTKVYSAPANDIDKWTAANKKVLFHGFTFLKPHCVMYNGFQIHIPVRVEDLLVFESRPSLTDEAHKILEK